MNASIRIVSNNMISTSTDEVTPRYNVDTCAMLVEFSAPMWTARKLDRSTTDEVIHNKNAGAHDAARVNKKLLAGRKELEVILKHVNATRAYVYDHTIPWSDRGMRLLPVADFPAFDARMQDAEEAFVKLVDEFDRVYPTLITAQAMALGEMFNRDDYPDPARIRAKFSWHVHYTPVPSAGDFRVDIGNAAQAELRRKLVEMADRRVEEAVRGLWDMFKEHLQRMSRQLTVEIGADGTERKSKLYDSLLDNGLDLCKRMRTLNLINDAQLEHARVELERTINSVDIDDLRKDVEARKEIKTRVDELLDKFNF
jgi:hypothetical protein